MERYKCRICERAVYTDGVTFADGTLTINLPAGSYADGDHYCIIVTDAIPTTATRGAPVVITIGGGTVEYPLIDSCGRQLTQEDISSRCRYRVRIRTTATGGTFAWVGRGCWPVERLTAIDGTEPAEAAVDAATGGDGA